MGANQRVKQLLLTGAALAWAPFAAAQPAPNRSTTVEEVIVTASKTGESVREVSGSAAP